MVSSPSSIFCSVLNAALEQYKKNKKTNFLDHPLAIQLQSCDSVVAMLSVLQDLVQQFGDSYSCIERRKNVFGPIMTALSLLPGIPSERVRMVSLKAIVPSESAV